VSVALIFLTLNEIDGMKKIMPKIKKEWVDEIVIVDGGSTDGTLEEAKKMGFKVVHQKDKGHGGGIRAGVAATTSDKIVIFGPDGNHEPEEIPKLIKKLDEGYDQVTISRFGKTSLNMDTGIINTFGNKSITFLTNLIFRGNLTDALNESRIITRKAMNELKFDAMQYDSTLQMCIRGLKKRQKFAEVIGNQPPRIGGKRKMRPSSTGYQCAKRIIKELIFWNF